jgi:NTE family protein
MGAIVGGLLASGVSPADLRQVMSEWPRRRRQLREWRFWRMHMASDRGVDRLLRHFFGERMVTAAEFPYAANAVDIERGEEVVITSGLLRDAARASMAYPGWLPPFVLNGRVLVDGATLNPVPSLACRWLGAHLIVAVSVLGPIVPSPLPRRWPMRNFEILARTFDMCGHSMSQTRSEAASDVVITPELGDATMASFDRYDAMVDAGVRAAEAHLPAIRATFARVRSARTEGSR